MVYFLSSAGTYLIFILQVIPSPSETSINHILFQTCYGFKNEDVVYIYSFGYSSNSVELISFLFVANIGYNRHTNYCLLPVRLFLQQVFNETKIQWCNSTYRTYPSSKLGCITTRSTFIPLDKFHLPSSGRQSNPRRTSVILLHEEL